MINYFLFYLQKNQITVLLFRLYKAENELIRK